MKRQKVLFLDGDMAEKIVRKNKALMVFGRKKQKRKDTARGRVISHFKST